MLLILGKDSWNYNQPQVLFALYISVFSFAAGVLSYLVTATSFAVDAGILTSHNLNIVASDGNTCGAIITREATTNTIHRIKLNTAQHKIEALKTCLQFVEYPAYVSCYRIQSPSTRLEGTHIIWVSCVLVTSAEIGLVDSDMVDRSVLARRPAAPNNPFSSPLKDGILGPSLGCASEERG